MPAASRNGGFARAAFALLVVVFAASISASGSRGGLLAGFGSLLVVVALTPLTTRLRLGLAALVAAGLVAAAWAIRFRARFPRHAPATRRCRRAGTPSGLCRSAQEIGHPWWTHRAGGAQRSLFNTSVRLRALRGTIDLALDRPLLGYGFGAEQWAFVNRYLAFSSGNPENGYVGIFLQLGFVGLALFVVVLVLCVLPALRGLLRRAARRRPARRRPAQLRPRCHGTEPVVLPRSRRHRVVAFWIALLVTAALAQVRRVEPRVAD